MIQDSITRQHRDKVHVQVTPELDVNEPSSPGTIFETMKTPKTTQLRFEDFEKQLTTLMHQEIDESKDMRPYVVSNQSTSVLVSEMGKTDSFVHRQTKGDEIITP